MNLKTTAVALWAAMTLCLAAGAQKKIQKPMEKNTLVVYFSATGTTRNAAALIAAAAQADLCEIVPERPYTAADLDWNNRASRSSTEMGNAKARPAIKAVRTDVSRYKRIFLGYPIWWDRAPRVINTFIERHNLKGKTVIPFATSGGSGIDGSLRALQKDYPGLKWQPGRLLNHAGKDAVEAWVASLKD